MSTIHTFQDNEQLIKLAKEGDEEAREEVYQNNIGLLYMVMERFKNTNYDYDDLFQVGAIGLIKAIDKFDFSFQVRFSTYAVPMIIGEIKKFLRDDSIIKVQRGLKETYSRIRWAQDNLRNDLKREPSVEEIAHLLEMEKEDVVLSMEACQAPVYIYDMLTNANDKDPLVLFDKLAHEDENEILLEKMALKEAIKHLNPREREVIIRRFFQDETQNKVAEALGVSQVQISRIEKAALLKLKGVMA